MQKAVSKSLSGILIVCGFVALFSSAVVWAHGSEQHKDQGVSVATQQTGFSDGKIPLDVGGSFSLVDHFGDSVSNESYLGKHMLVFFGYASCKNMCSLSLGRIGQALVLLGELESKLSSIIITVDPQHDTADVMRAELAKYHPSLIGHTGSAEQLKSVYEAYKQKPVEVDQDWEGDVVISHSSYFYLMDPQGKFQTLFPPILNPQSMANIISKYLSPG